MNGIAALSLVIVGASACAGASCSKGAATVSQDPPRASSARWTVTLDVVGGDDRFSLLDIDSVSATRADHPVMVAGVTFATDQPTAIGRFDGPGQSNGEVIGVVESPSGTTIATLSGEHYVIPHGSDEIEQRWYDLAPGVVGVIRTAAGVRVERHDRGAATPTWTHAIADAKIGDASIDGWLASGDPVVVVRRAADADVLSVHLADGATTPIATIPGAQLRIALANPTHNFAAVYAVAQPGGGDQTRVDVRALTGGAVVRTFDPAWTDDMIFPFDERVSMGFDGRYLWLYRYSPEHNNDVLGTKSPEKCSYDVYDVEHGKRVRTLAQASGDWARLSGSCRVHALLPTLDGGAIAFAVGGDRKAEVVKFDGPP